MVDLKQSKDHHRHNKLFPLFQSTNMAFQPVGGNVDQCLFGINISEKKFSSLLSLEPREPKRGGRGELGEKGIFWKGKMGICSSSDEPFFCLCSVEGGFGSHSVKVPHQ